MSTCKKIAAEVKLSNSSSTTYVVEPAWALKPRMPASAVGFFQVRGNRCQRFIRRPFSAMSNFACDPLEGGTSIDAVDPRKKIARAPKVL
jgi:hypothetical protein